MTQRKGKNKKQRGGHPPKQRSVEEEEIVEKPNKNIQRHRDYRAKKRCEFTSLQKQKELFMKFCYEKGITEEWEAFLEKHEEEQEEQRKYCEELGMVSEAFENEANQHSDKEIQKILKNSSNNPLATLEENLESEMIQTGGLEGVTATNSSSLEAMGTPFEQVSELERKREEELDGARQGKRPAIAYIAPSHPRIGGLMAEARLNYDQSVAALATQGSLLSTNQCTQIQMREATHDREASTSSWARPPHHELGLGSKQEVSEYDLVKQYVKLKDAKRRQQEAAAATIDANRKFKEKKKEADNLNRQVKELEEGLGKLKVELAEKGKSSKVALDVLMINAVTLGWNLLKELLQSMQPGSEFLNWPLLGTIQHHPSLQNRFNERLTLIGHGHSIYYDKVAIQRDNSPLVFRCRWIWSSKLLENYVEREPSYHNWLENARACVPNSFAPLGDAANSSQFQAANARAYNVEQEDDANDQRMDEAIEADDPDWMRLHIPDSGEDP